MAATVLTIHVVVTRTAAVKLANLFFGSLDLYAVMRDGSDNVLE